MGAVGVALLLNVAPLGLWLDHFFGTPNLSIVLSQVLAFVDAWAAVEMVMASTARVRGVQRCVRAAVLAGAAVALLAAFAAAPPWPERPVVAFFVETSQQEGYRLYWLIYAVLSMLPSIYLAMSSVRHARQAMPWLRSGLVVVGIGATLCAVFSALLLVSVLVGASEALGIVQMAFIATGCALVALGVGLPHWPDVASRRRLHPMWSSLTALYPEVRASRRPDLRRLVTEVHDAVVVARTRDELASPLICAVAVLPSRAADAFEETVADLVAVARQGLSAEWNSETWAGNEVSSR